MKFKSFKYILILFFLETILSQCYQSGQYYSLIPDSSVSEIHNFTIECISKVKRSFDCLSRCNLLPKCNSVSYHKDKLECFFYSLPNLNITHYLKLNESGDINIKKGNL